MLPGSEVVKEVFDRFHYLDQDGRDLVKNSVEILHIELFIRTNLQKLLDSDLLYSSRIGENKI